MRRDGSFVSRIFTAVSIFAVIALMAWPSDQIRTKNLDAEVIDSFSLTGEIRIYSASTAPTGWTTADGHTEDETLEPALFTIIGEIYGDGGDGAGGLYNVPDLRGRLPLGLDNMGGTSANRVTNAQADSLGGNTGVENQALSVANLAAHSHPASSGGWTRNTLGGAPSLPVVTLGGIFAGTIPVSVSVGSQGSGTAHNNMSPYLALNYIIKL